MSLKMSQVLGVDARLLEVRWFFVGLSRKKGEDREWEWDALSVLSWERT